ncbi:zinc-dependent metalloprotease [Saccharothrix sp. NPDC042600]|uniref:zinc-dependent metalloprotease n=1 Tax=Saccharothrix TaxID=2071 RepID=UPI0033DFAD41|nr:zinc-dependent metalloprotease [Saccharothrix mutabilis subsp. capreolus]
MSDVPFGFSPQDPDDRDRKPQEPGGNPFDFSQLGAMLSQLGAMFSGAGTSSGPVNYDLAKQIALQQLAGKGGMGFAPDQSGAVADAVHLAEMWLDPVTALPAGTTKAEGWTARDWVERTLPTWQRLCDPVARRMSGAWVEAMPAEAKEAAGPLLSMLGQMGGMAFGSQLGGALAQLGSEVLTSTEVGLPLGPEGTAALLPANIEKFTEGLERPASEVLVFLAAREAAHQRLFSHVPWLRQRLLDTVEEFARGITVDTSALEQLAGQVDPANPASIEEAMKSGVLEPQTTPEQKAALTRLETLLALVEGWVDVVVAEAVTERLPGAEALRETLRRRRASGGPAEQTFATLVGLELRPRRHRSAAALWKLLGDQQGIEQRDSVWEHPDLVPTAEDLDDPMEFVERFGQTRKALEDPIAELERTLRDSSADSPGSESPDADSPDSDGPGSDGPEAGKRED